MDQITLETRTRCRPRMDNICLNCQGRYEKVPTGRPGYCPACKPDKVKTYFKKYRDKERQECLDHYGRVCKCCGSAQEEFLTFDHINGRGNAHRREIKGERLTRWLRKSRFPEGFRVLCFNCNSAKAIYGSCPHARV